MTLMTNRERLALLEERRCAVVDAMDRISARFVAQVAEELPDRWEQIVRRLLSNEPHEAKAQGSEGLSRLKRQLRRLQARADGVATRHLSGPQVWRHKALAVDDTTNHAYQSNGSLLSSNTGFQHSSRVWAAIGRAEGEVLGVLRPHFAECSGLLAQTEQNRPSGPLEQMIEAYEKLSDQLEKVDDERRALNRQIVLEEVNRLWENA